MSSSKYSILVDDTEVAVKSKKASAIEAADALRVDNEDAVIEVKTSAGNVVHTVKVKGTHSKPWTRVETHDGIEVEVPEGYTVGYTRARVGAVVARKDDKSGWLVITADGSTEAKNTKEAREITNELAAAHRAKVDAEKEAEAAKRAEAKAKREADRKAAAEAKEAEKVAKAEAKAAAKAEKEAAEKLAAEVETDEVEEDAEVEVEEV